MVVSLNGSSDGLHFGSQRSQGSLRSQILSQNNQPNSLLGSLRSQGSARSQASQYRRHDIATDPDLIRQINLSANFSEALSENGDVTFQRSQASQPSQPSQQSQPEESQSQSTVVDSQLVIWGTDVSLSLCKQKFRNFLYHDCFDADSLDPEELDAVRLPNGS